MDITIQCKQCRHCDICNLKMKIFVLRNTIEELGYSNTLTCDIGCVNLERLSSYELLRTKTNRREYG